MAMAMGPDIRELSFQNVIDSILKPAGVKVGGYPDDMFLDMEEDDKEKWTCNICYLIVREARQCDNKHLFCRTCSFAWTLTFSENSQRCPMCRSEQKKYHAVDGMDTEVGKHRVQCPEDNCDFRAPLSIFLQHSHGMKKFRNETTDLESLRPNRPPGASLLVFPNPSGRNPVERALNLRDQLTQGRMMLHQMMLLLQLEMQLRRQAAISTIQDRGIRQVDEMFALNEQLSEVGGVLHALMNVPMRSSGESGGHPAARIILAALGDDDNTSESSESSDSSVVSRYRSQYIIRGNRNRINNTSSEEDNTGNRARMTIRVSPRMPTLQSSSNNDSSNSTESRAVDQLSVTSSSLQTSRSPQLSFSPRESATTSTERPLRRSDIRSQLYGNTGQVCTSNQSPVPVNTPRILQRPAQNNAPLSVHADIVTPVVSQTRSQGSSSTTQVNLSSNRPALLNETSRENQGPLTASRDTIHQSTSTSLPPITTSQLSTGRQVTNANSPVPPGSSAHQLTMREFAADRPSHTTVADRNQLSRVDDQAIVTVHGSGPTQRINRFRRESAARPDAVTEPQVAHSQIRQASVTIQEPTPSQEIPSTSHSSRRSSVGIANQSLVAGTAHFQESGRTSGSYSPQKRFRHDSSNRPILRQVQHNNNGQTNGTSSNRTAQNSHRAAQNSQSNRTANRSENGAENAFPTTPGSLIRARRRSEIQRQLHESFNDS